MIEGHSGEPGEKESSSDIGKRESSDVKGGLIRRYKSERPKIRPNGEFYCWSK